MKTSHQIIGAIAGWTIGGPFGAFLVGFGLIQADNIFKSCNNSKKQFKKTYGDLALSVLFLFRWVCLVDRKLQKQEEAFVRNFLLYEFGADAVEMGIKAFHEIKTGPITPLVEDISKQIKDHTSIEERIVLIDNLFRLANADKVITDKEERRVQNISKIIDLPESEYIRLKAMYVFERKRAENRSFARAFKPRLSNAYLILGLEETCSETELKKAFRKLAKEHHPDKFVHLGLQATNLAEDRFQKILAAYEFINEHRHLIKR